MWELAEVNAAGERIYTSTGEQALKWVIAELCGAPAETGKSRSANADLRHQIHHLLVQEGWADRLSQRRFHLVADPASRAERPAAAVDPGDSGETVEAVSVDAVVDENDHLTVGGLAWSHWTDLAVAAQNATTSPGVYLARCEGQIVYVGMAGERQGQGVRGRFRIYARGRGAVSGLGEAVLDRALADHEWLTSRVAALESDGPARTKEWAVAAFSRRPLEVVWAAADSADAALAIEHQILVELADVALWNRARPAR